MSDYETPNEVLYQQFFEDLKKSVPIMNDYTDVFFRISDDIGNTVFSCLNNEMEDSKIFRKEHQTLSVKHRFTIVGLLIHCLLQDPIAAKLLFQRSVLKIKTR